MATEAATTSSVAPPPNNQPTATRTTPTATSTAPATSSAPTTNGTDPNNLFASTTTNFAPAAERNILNSYRSVNYRFTPTVAGKYFVYIIQRIIVTNNSQLVSCGLYLYKNGSQVDGATAGQNLSDNYIRAIICPMNAVVDMNGSTDYLEVFGDYNANDNITTSSGFHSAGSKFGGYRIGS